MKNTKIKNVSYRLEIKKDSVLRYFFLNVCKTIRIRKLLESSANQSVATSGKEGGKHGRNTAFPQMFTLTRKSRTASRRPPLDRAFKH